MQQLGGEIKQTAFSYSGIWRCYCSDSWEGSVLGHLSLTAQSASWAR